MAEDELMDPRQLFQAAVHVGVHAGDQLELALAEIGGDVRVGERRAERRRMRRDRERAVGPNAEAFLLDAATDLRERFVRERLQPVLEMAHLYKGIRHPRRSCTTALKSLQTAKKSRYTFVAVTTREGSGNWNAQEQCCRAPSAESHRWRCSS